MAKTTVAVFVVIDEDGDVDAAAGQPDYSDDARAAALERFTENVGSSLMRRVVRLNVTLDLPVATELDVTVPAEAGQHLAAEAE